MDWNRYYNLEALEANGECAEALAGYQHLLSSVSTPTERNSVLLGIASCQRRLGRDSETRATLAEAYRAVEKGSENYAWTLFIDACLEIDDGHWKQALTKLDSILADFSELFSLPENEKDFEAIQRKRGIALYELRKLDDAYPLLQRAAARQEQKSDALYYFGRCCYDLGRLEESKRAIREALTLDLHPTYMPSAHYVLGLCYYWLGQPAWAVREYEWCLENDRDHLVQESKLLTGLIEASKVLGLAKDVEKYSKILAGE